MIKLSGSFGERVSPGLIRLKRVGVIGIKLIISVHMNFLLNVFEMNIKLKRYEKFYN